jgi:hypothetical protein
MLRYHMLVVTRDAGLKRAIKRLTTATGATADFVTDLDQPASRSVDLAIVDARDDEPDRGRLAALPASTRLLYIIAEGTLLDRLPLLADGRAVSLFCHDERFDDDEFISSATKALRGEVFGLQKYFPWGVTTFTMVVKNYDEKTKAIDIMLRYATMAGVRGPVRDRIQLVADELMMNALYHAPVDERGGELYAGKTQKELSQLGAVSAIQVQYGCSGRYFGIAVRDGSGSLRREKALDYLVRARSGAQIESKATGAGLGLVSVLSSVSKLIFNLAPKASTEVIGLFDMELFGKGKVGARSVHLFVAEARADAGAEAGDDDATATDRTAAPAEPRRAGWVLAVGLAAVVAVMAVMVAVKKSGGSATAATGRSSVVVVAEPATAEVRVNGRPVPSGAVVELAGSAGAEVVVSAAGHREFRRTLPPGEVGPGTRIYVHLDPTE